jgi:two-component system, NtrC family, sensor histidine kinase HydH
MTTRLILRMTAPVVALSLLLLTGGVVTAWFVQRWQKAVTYDLRVNVSGVRAAEELEILVREARTRLDYFLITGDSRYLAQVPELRSETERWLAEAERWADTAREQQLVSRVRQGHRLFWSELERITAQVPRPEQATAVRRLIDNVIVREMVEPTHEFLDLNEVQVEEAIAGHQAFGDRLIYGLLILGTCGSAAGVVAGFGFARRLSRSLVQLSVLIRDAAGRLEAGVGPITFPRGDLGELEVVLRLIGERVGTIVQRLQQKEHEVLRAEQMAAVGQLAAGMAHELRNPLTSMKLLVQGAMAAPAADVGAANLNLGSRDLIVLEEEITRLEQLIQSFLDFARPPKLEKRILDVRPLVEQTLAFVAGRAAAAAAKIELDAPPRPARAAVDAGQFRQILLNLVLNALDAIPDGGSIRVVVEYEGDTWLTLRVADDGSGLPAALGERIFEPFTTTKETGLGLGLSICKRIAEAHGGSLSGSSRAEGGAVFTLRLPAA